MATLLKRIVGHYLENTQTETGMAEVCITELLYLSQPSVAQPLTSTVSANLKFMYYLYG